MKSMMKSCGGMLAVCALVATPAFADDTGVSTEDGYVESLGKQFVNLRAFKTANTRVWLDFQTTYEFDNAYHSLLGTDGSKTGSWFNFYVDANGKFYYKFGDTAAFVTPAAYDTNRHTMELALNANGAGTHRLVFTTGSVTNLDTTSTVACSKTTESCPLMLFGCGWDYKNGEYAVQPTKMKVYGVKIWEGTELIHDYVPRKVEGKFYLKDLVDGKYVTGVARADGTAMDELLTGGGTIVEEPGDAYIESHAHECIDLGIKADGTTCVELDHQLTAIPSESYLFGVRAVHDTSLTFWGYCAASGTKLGYECYDGDPRWEYFSLNAKDGIAPAFLRRTLVVDASNSKASYENAGYECSSLGIGGSHVNESSANMGLFGARAGSSLNGSASMKFYGMNVYKNGELIKAFKPYIKSALPGIVDQDGNFLTTSDETSRTTEMFKVGGAIAGDSGMDDAFIETTGSEYVDSGWVPQSDGKIVMDFALPDLTIKDVYFFGVRDGGTGPYLWLGISGGRLAVATGSTTWQYVNGANVLNRGRYELTLDIPTHSATLSQGGATIATTSLKAADPLPTTTVAIGGLRISASSITAGAKFRLYSFKIYEGSDLVKSFVPTRSANGNIGLYDSVGKGTKEPTQTAGLKLFGKTIDGVDQGFTQTPPEKVTLFKGDSVTLTASAPLATSYVWRRNGVVIKGETGPSYTVQPGGRRTVLYSVTPVYTANRIVGSEDVQVEGESAETEVVFQNGMAVIVR